MFERFRKPIQCHRLSPGTDNPDGTYTEGSRTSFTINASKQPATPDEMLSLPEGRRSRETFTLYYQNAAPLQTVETSQSRNPDIVEIFGEEYEVVSTAKWRNDVISHWKSLVQRIQPDQGCEYEEEGGGGLSADFTVTNAHETSPDEQEYTFYL